MNSDLWPMNPESRKVDKSLDWSLVAVKAIESATPSMLRKVPSPKLNQLKRTFPEMYARLSAECKETVDAVLEGRPDEGVVKSDTVTKESVIKHLREIDSDAAADGDTMARIAVVKQISTLEGLDKVKPAQQDEDLATKIDKAIARLEAAGYYSGAKR